MRQEEISHLAIHISFGILTLRKKTFFFIKGPIKTAARAPPRKKFLSFFLHEEKFSFIGLCHFFFFFFEMCLTG